MFPGSEPIDMQCSGNKIPKFKGPKLIIQVGRQRAKVTNTELADKILLEKAKYIRLASISFLDGS
ncbi:hypothetical protein WN943_017790 [Citrus x changshan-huyou]